VKTIIIAGMLSGGLIGAANASDFQLAPYKDKLFAYPKTLEQSQDGSYQVVDFNKQRDVYGRDEIPLRKAHYKYVNERVRWSRGVKSYKSANGRFKYFTVGKSKGAKITLIWIHGKGGNRRQGVNNWTFGGNFNRLQNLMVNNNGVLVSPDFSDFEHKGAVDIASLMRESKQRSPNGALILACGSMGGRICWQLINNPETSAMMDGMLLLNDFLKSPTAKKGGRPVPIFIGHGTQDVVFPPKVQKAFFDKIRKQNPGYPARFVMFNTGVHGTPIRMVDWRRELNWMLSLKK